MAAAVVVVEIRICSREIIWLAIGARSAVDFVAHFRIDFLRPPHVIADEQIQPAVVVVIQPRRAGAPIIGRAAHAGARRHFPELSLPVVVKEVIAAHRRDEHVVQAVVVVIADGHTHAVETRVQTGTGGDIAEAALAVVMIKGVGGGFPAGGKVPGPVGGVDEEQVGGAVVVEVEEGHAAAHGFGQQFVSVSAVVVDESDARLSGDVGEPGDGDFRFRLVRDFRCADLSDLLRKRSGFSFEDEHDAENDDRHCHGNDQRPARGFADDGVVRVDQFLMLRDSKN